ncbi:ATP-binding cassette domain-containing protein [Escherichia coli]|uniref:ATP-binding cassette domain-containing protein n=1 Tax=Escherichia coli TaxID=562 RepID=UPI000E03D3B1|nr:putative GTP-binding protein [Escherichia coli]
MNPSDAIEAIEKPLSSLPYSLSRHILEHLRKLTSHEPVIGIMGKSGAGKSSLCNALFQGEVTPVSDVHVTNGAIVIHTQRLKSDPGGNLLS